MTTRIALNNALDRRRREALQSAKELIPVLHSRIRDMQHALDIMQSAVADGNAEPLIWAADKLADPNQSFNAELTARMIQRLEVEADNLSALLEVQREA